MRYLCLLYHGTELAAAGIPLTAVRDRLGHTSLATTSIYAHARRVRDRGRGGGNRPRSPR